MGPAARSPTAWWKSTFSSRSARKRPSATSSTSTLRSHYKFPLTFDASKEFHVWGLEWEEGRLTWYLDGKKIRVYEGGTPQHEMFILIGLYQGIFGAADPKMNYPRDFEIDYVKVWKRADQ